MLDVQPDEFANYFSTETGEDVLIAQVRLLLSYALLLVGRCDYGYGVFDRLSNPFPACLATFIVVKIHIDDDRVNLILVLADCLKQRNGNNAAIENPRIKPLYSVFLLPSPIRCSHRIDATASRRAVQQSGVVTSSALQRNAEPIMPRRLIASTAQRHRRLAVTESTHGDRHPLPDPNCKA